MVCWSSQLLGHSIVGKNSMLVRKNTSYQRYILYKYVGALVIVAIFASTLVRWSSQLLGHFIVSKNSTLVHKNTSYQHYIRYKYVGTMVIPVVGSFYSQLK